MPVFKLITAPATEPLTFADLPSDQLRISGTDEQSLVNSYIKTARRIAEDRQNRALITQTWEMYLPDFYDYEIVIDKTPVQSIEFIKYYDEAGDLQTIDAANYELDTVSEPARLKPVYGQSWPSSVYDKFNPIIIRFVCGYGTASDVPEETKDAMLMIIAHLYENRGDEGHRVFPKAIYDLLDMNRIALFR